MKNRGFTLIELVIGLFLLSIIAKIGVNAFQYYAEKTRLRTAAREVIADFTNCLAKAKSENRVYTITFDTLSSPSSYTISAPATGTLGALNSVKIVSANAVTVAMTGVGFTGCNTVRITQRGLLEHCGVTPSPQNTTGTVTLINRRGSTAIVTINTMVKAYVNFL
jgi:prepilin-type N-terminal cleavage/methylation domain-containing protein